MNDVGVMLSELPTRAWNERSGNKQCQTDRTGLKNKKQKTQSNRNNHVEMVNKSLGFVSRFIKKPSEYW